MMASISRFMPVEKRRKRRRKLKDLRLVILTAFVEIDCPRLNTTCDTERAMSYYVYHIQCQSAVLYQLDPLWLILR
jgi:hypothetical protein